MIMRDELHVAPRTRNRTRKRHDRGNDTTAATTTIAGNNDDRGNDNDR